LQRIENRFFSFISSLHCDSYILLICQNMSTYYWGSRRPLSKPSSLSLPLPLAVRAKQRNHSIETVFLPSPFFHLPSSFIRGLTARPDAPLYKSDSSAILIYCSLKKIIRGVKMMLRVQYQNYCYDYVDARTLDKLITRKGIRQFYRPAEERWVNVDSDPIRGLRGAFSGFERRRPRMAI